ncbi:S8 family serine peptidase [Tabrizicola sp. YIM 78059]|uniref:S8 family serine peptidase n=1 Tax=Tabrizicola sp. YIM 78059 TaxID=2529861 RepID=UPI00145A77B9|nr:S8 family serine peptidase [Tabrizicola sp. YIM 78059]
MPLLPRILRAPALPLSFSSLALLAACGGGGDGRTDLSAYLPDFAAPPPIAISLLSRGYLFDEAAVTASLAALLARPEYDNGAGIAWLRQFIDPGVPAGATNQPLRSSGAAFAHAAGLTGTGQVIAISDSHISATHESLAGRVTVVSNGPAVVCGPSVCYDDEHGTSVASVALGFSPNFVGTAPGATAIFGYYGDPGQWTKLSELGQAAITAKAVAWNNSWGYGGLSADQSGFNAAFAGPDGAAYYNTLHAYAVNRPGPDPEGVVVFAVANADTGGSGIMDGLPWLRPEFEAGWLAVANGVPTVSLDGDVTSVHLLSSPCYQSARWCIVADGSWDAAVYGGAIYDETTGSSFAAPQVAGALALLAEAFPDLTPHQLRVRLLASADTLFSGFAADDRVELAAGFFKDYSVIYGHGFLDIEAALRPIGAVTLPLANGMALHTDTPPLRTGSAFGDAVERSLAGTEVGVRDALAAGFVMPGAALASGARPGAQAGRLLAQGLGGNLTAERMAEPAALATPFAAHAGPVATLTTPDGTARASILLPTEGSQTAGFSLSRALTDGATRIEMGVKLLRDDGDLTSMDSRNTATMASVTLGITQDLGAGAFLALSGEVGVTDLGGETAFGATGSARFDAVKLTAGQGGIFSAGDRLSVGIGMPLAISAGRTKLELPVVRNGASTGFESVALDLAPQDRQLDLEMTYQTALTDGLEMKLSLIRSDNFGNRAGERDTSGALAFAFRF